MKALILTVLTLAVLTVALTAGTASAGEQFTSLNAVPAVAVYAFVDANSEAIGVSSQAAADYLAGILDDAGVDIDGASDVIFRLSVETTMLRDRLNPAIGSNTTAFVMTLNCYKLTDDGLLLYWRDYSFGGYSGVQADDIISELSEGVRGMAVDFADAYVADRGVASN